MKTIIIFILLLILLGQCTSNDTEAKPTLGGVGKVLSCMFEPDDEWCIAERERQKGHLK